MNKKLIKVQNVKKSFKVGGNESVIIDGLNLDIYEGDFTVIMGASGSGKSTILYMLSGMDKTTTGDVIFDGKDLKKLNKREIAKFRKERIGFIFQGINLIPYLTILENVIVAGYLKKNPKSKILERSKKLLKTVGLEKEMYKKPSQVSGGQAQRAAIVRALINEPMVIFADEPTGALNSQNSLEILNILSELHEQGQSIVMVTHDTKAAMRGNRVIYIQDGKIIGDIELGAYEQSPERENKLNMFLTERGW